jgi:hypothetical protein
MSEAQPENGENSLILPGSWHAAVSCRGQWELGVAVGRGESQPRHIKRNDGILGVAKPAIHPRGIFRGANEKIASDLAYRLGLPVPPVVLWSDPDDPTSLYSISGWACKQPDFWDNQLPNLSDTFKANCAQLIADVTIFHTWIGDGDRHGQNTLVDLESSEDAPRLYFIDHAFCMSGAFGDLTDINKITHNYYPQVWIQHNMLAKMLSLIENLDSDDIAGIVSRIPAPFLNQDKSAKIAQELVRRKELLAAVFKI